MASRGPPKIDDLQPRVLGVEPHHPHVWRHRSSSAVAGSNTQRSVSANKQAFSNNAPGGGHGPQAVIVKCEIVTHNRGTVQSLDQHARYLERDGDDQATAIGDASYMARRGRQALFGPGDLNDWAGDRHHFRLIVSPERGDRLDMHAYVHDLVGRIQADQGRKIAWRAVVHHDTDTVHAHILMRGRDGRGRYVSLPIDYLYHTVRDAASELATERLGERSRVDLDHARMKQVHSQHYTDLDRELEARTLRINDLDGPARQRLMWLVDEGHAEARGFGLYAIADHLIDRLRRHDRTRTRIARDQTGRLERGRLRGRDIDNDLA